MTAFGLIFVTVLALATALRLLLGMRHIAYVQAHRSAVPPQFTSEVSLDSHQRAADYTSAKTRLALIAVAVDTALVLWLTLGGLIICGLWIAFATKPPNCPPPFR